jgi:hypothetical protein
MLLSRIGIHFTSHPLGRNRPQEKPLACPARKKKEGLEPQPKIVGRNHSVQAASLSCSCRCLAETDALTTSCFSK